VEVGPGWVAGLAGWSWWSLFGQSTELATLPGWNHRS
jgi:hypothetical protein